VEGEPLERGIAIAVLRRAEGRRRALRRVAALALAIAFGCGLCTSARAEELLSQPPIAAPGPAPQGEASGAPKAEAQMPRRSLRCPRPADPRRRYFECKNEPFDAETETLSGALSRGTSQTKAGRPTSAPVNDKGKDND
jgi:hypothetical protein